MRRLVRTIIIEPGAPARELYLPSCDDGNAVFDVDTDVIGLLDVDTDIIDLGNDLSLYFYSLGGGEPLVPLPPLNEVLLAGGNLVVVRDHPDCAEIVDVTDADIAYVNDLIAEALDFPR
jgi:hypothetical protein